MGKYFNHNDIDLIEREDVVKLLNRADKHPDRFIRIALNQDGMHLDNKSKAEFEIYQAVIFIWDANGKIYRYDFRQNDPERPSGARAPPAEVAAAAAPARVWGNSVSYIVGPTASFPVRHRMALFLTSPQLTAPVNVTEAHR